MSSNLSDIANQVLNFNSLPEELLYLQETTYEMVDYMTTYDKFIVSRTQDEQLQFIIYELSGNKGLLEQTVSILKKSNCV